MHIIRVVDKGQEQGDSAGGSGDTAMDQIAALYGANEIIRYVYVYVTNGIGYTFRFHI